jgi:hypothetical protein
MFTAKKTQLFETVKKASVSTTNAFVNAGMKTSALTASGNGAVKYKTTGNPFVDQFGVIGSYKQQRSFADISKDCEILWARNPVYAVMFILYIRMITRVVQLFNGLSTKVSQKGGEMKHEGIMRMIWLHIKAPNTFWKNIGLFVSVGSWKDIIVMLQYDLIYNGWEDRKLNWAKFGSLILTGLRNDNVSNLLKKYLPQIKSRSKCTTVEAQADVIIAKWIASIAGVDYKRYRKLKTSGTAHEWQKLISQKRFSEIDFNTIHGRALNLLVKGKFLYNQGLRQKYEEWITAPETVAVKFTGFVHEVMDMCVKYSHQSQMPIHKQATVNKQFATLVEKGGESQASRLIVVRDTSGSMSVQATGTNMSCYDIGKALALYFSEFLTGAFANSWIEFNSTAQMHQWIGNTPVDKWFNDESGFYGSTDFQSVIKLFVRLKQQGVPESEFPTGILCISDSEFNPGQLGKTNVETALATLRRGGFSEDYVNNFVIVLWNLQSSYYGSDTGKKFETFGNTPNVFYFSGYSPAVISFLSDKIKNAEELFEEAMDQEILRMIEL